MKWIPVLNLKKAIDQYESNNSYQLKTFTGDWNDLKVWTQCTRLSIYSFASVSVYKNTISKLYYIYHTYVKKNSRTLLY